MSNGQSTPYGDTLRAQNATQETPNKPSSKMIEREEIENTPFVIVTLPEENTKFLTIGDYRISPNFQNKGEIIEYLHVHMWDIILQLIGCALDKLPQKHNLVQAYEPEKP